MLRTNPQELNRRGRTWVRIILIGGSVVLLSCVLFFAGLPLYHGGGPTALGGAPVWLIGERAAPYSSTLGTGSAPSLVSAGSQETSTTRYYELSVGDFHWAILVLK